jgi:hypothetical protein
VNEVTDLDAGSASEIQVVQQTQHKHDPASYGETNQHRRTGGMTAELRLQQDEREVRLSRELYVLFYILLRENVSVSPLDRLCFA